MIFEKVIIADDLDSVNKGVLTQLKDMGIQHITQESYCDDVYLKIKHAEKAGEPFQLVISDLSFKSDYRNQKFHSGEELAEALKKEYPHLKVIIFSVEDRIQRVRGLLKKGIDAYVCKSRKGIQELREAIHHVYQNDIYLSPQVSRAAGDNDIVEITDYDILLLKHLSYGQGQEEIRQHFLQNSIKPNSISSIEKSIGHLKVQFRANNVPHLIALTKDLGII